eukprot:6455883-Amphidinium_carterae.1
MDTVVWALLIWFICPPLQTFPRCSFNTYTSANAKRDFAKRAFANQFVPLTKYVLKRLAPRGRTRKAHHERHSWHVLIILLGTHRSSLWVPLMSEATCRLAEHLSKMTRCSNTRTFVLNEANQIL